MLLGIVVDAILALDIGTHHKNRFEEDSLVPSSWIFVILKTASNPHAFIAHDLGMVGQKFVQRYPGLHQ